MKSQVMDLDDIKKWLESEGFKIANNPMHDHYNDCHWYAYRRSKLEARECETNEGKGCQIVVCPYYSKFGAYTHNSIEIEVCGEANNIWWKLQAYSISYDQLRDKLPAIEVSLVNAWNSLKLKE